MSEALIKTVQDMLNEEKWTRTTIPDYSTRNFIELDKLLMQIEADHCIDDIKKTCDEHLAITKDSIIALYLSGVITLKKQMLDDSAMVKLVNIFADKPNKGDIVEYLCKRIKQEYPESKFALRTLVDYYAGIKDKDPEEVFQVWKDLVQADFEEAELAKHIAEKYEKDYQADGKESTRLNAVEYYTKALNRYINRIQEENVDLIWSKLIELRPNDLSFFYHMEKKIAKNISIEKAAKLLGRLYEHYRLKADTSDSSAETEDTEAKVDNTDWDRSIEILKKMLGYDENDTVSRARLVECYKGKYKNHSQLQKCISAADLARNYRNVYEAIADFEKRIAFDKGNYVYHRTWGIGQITAVENSNVTICFYPVGGGAKAKGTDRSMTLDMAVTSLQVLSKKHIWVIKSRCNAKSIADKIKDISKDSGKKTAKAKNMEGTRWILKTIIKSFDNNCDMKKVKDELVPDIFTPAEWTTWSVKARKMLNTDSMFAVNPNNMDMYQVRENLSQEEKLYNEFKAQKDFFARLKTLDAYVFPEGEDGPLDTESEFFKEMFDYIAGYLKDPTTVNEMTVAAYLEMDKIKTNPETKNLDLFKKNDIKCQFTDLFAKISNYNCIYTDLKNPELKKIYLKKIYQLIPDWTDIYIQLFPVVLSQDIFDQLLTNGHEEKVKAFTANAFEHYRDYRETVLWIFKSCINTEWFKSIGISYEKALITLIHILDITYREIENHCNTVDNKKINKQAQVLLFDNNTLETYMFSKDIDTVSRLYTLIDDVKALDPAIKLSIRSRILAEYKDFKFITAATEEKPLSTGIKGLIVTSRMYKEKQLELERIMSEILANTKDISTARELGDLKENSEYKAAKEKEGHLNTNASKLKAEIDKAQLFDPASVNTSVISFGTTAKLRNENTGDTESYTIFGPWESDPDNNIISYLAPFGNALLNHKVGEKFDFVINDNQNSYTVLEITAAAL